MVRASVLEDFSHRFVTIRDGYVAFKVEKYIVANAVDKVGATTAAK